MESQPQNPEFRINPENFHLCVSEMNRISVSQTMKGKGDENF